MLDLLFLAIAASYGVKMLILGLSLRKSAGVANDTDGEPTVSVIVAARNEADRLGACLESLARLNYPSTKLELVVIDDHSTDETEKIAARFGAGRPNFKVLRSPPEKANLLGKTNALVHGIRNTSGEIIMLTDADCMVNPDWVRKSLPYFDEQTGILGGYTLLQAGGVFQAVQALDWLYLFSVASSTATLGAPLTVIGNNFSFRRSAYIESGGYEELPFSVTEDYSLVQAILTKTSYRLKFPTDPGTVVTSGACPTVHALFRQKQRWGVGGLDMIPLGKAIIGHSWLTRVALALGVFLVSGWIFAAGAAVVIAADYFFLNVSVRLLGLKSLTKYLPAFEAYFTLYGIILPFIAVGSRNVVWKERSLRREKKNAFPSERH